MNGSKTILVACGTAVATSTVVAVGIQEILKEKGLSVQTRQCKASEIRTKLDGVDLVVATTPVPKDLGIPVIQTLAFLTGIGKEDVIDQIIAELT